MTLGQASKLVATFGRLLCVPFFVLCAVPFSKCEEPVKATVCQLKNDPPTYNHKLVEVTGFVTHASRDFTVFDPNCPSWPAIWLEYGGTLNSGTVNCCRTINDRRRSQELTVEDIPLPLTLNQQFEQFDKAIQPPFRSGQSGAVEHATLVGRFFAGQRLEDLNGHYWGGYGHMGCCSLLAIQEVKDPDTQSWSDLDYGESNEKLDFPQPGCTLRMLLPEEQNAALMQAQHEAEDGRRDWAFNDSVRVASDALLHAAHVSPDSLTDIKLTHDSPGRKTYEWKAVGNSHTGNAKSYMVVVSRPYWLSFYAHDRQRVAWVAIIAYEASCGGEIP